MTKKQMVKEVIKKLGIHASWREIANCMQNQFKTSVSRKFIAKVMTEVINTMNTEKLLPSKTQVFHEKVSSDFETEILAMMMKKIINESHLKISNRLIEKYNISVKDLALMKKAWDQFGGHARHTIVNNVLYELLS